MTAFDITTLQDASILTLNDMQDQILINPEYQREGGVWNRYKKQLFIDSLLNKYDVPKFYFHRLAGDFKSADKEYAIIDGRQRLEAIWEFLNNEFPLSDDFVFLEDSSIELAGLYFKDFRSVNSRMTTRLYGRSLVVMVVITDDLDFIEDMFTRLNEAAPLNAAEKRNSFGGPLPKITRELVRHPFFTETIKVSPSRYRHHDLVAKMIFLEFGTQNFDVVSDTKKATLDHFYRFFKDRDPAELNNTLSVLQSTLDAMADVFGNKDELLRSAGVIPVYYMLFAKMVRDGGQILIDRSDLLAFEERRASNRLLFQQEATDVDFRLLEYDELAQSSNDGTALSARLETLIEYLGLGTKPAAELATS
jgi:hypothetical protein